MGPINTYYFDLNIRPSEERLVWMETTFHMRIVRIEKIDEIYRLIMTPKERDAN